VCLPPAPFALRLITLNAAAPADNMTLQNHGYGIYCRRYTSGLFFNMESSSMRRVLLPALIVTLLTVSLQAADLYKVTVAGPADAALLQSHGVAPVVRIADGYLVVVSGESAARLEQSPLKSILIRAGVARTELALDLRLDDANLARYELLFQE